MTTDWDGTLAGQEMHATSKMEHRY